MVLMSGFWTFVHVIATNTWFQHKPIHQYTWYRNGNRSHPDHMLDYVLFNRRFRSSVLDTRVYRSVYLESDHEMVVSTLCFKIKAKRYQPKRGPQHQTQSLPSDVKSVFRSSLSDCCSVFTSWSTHQHLLWQAGREQRN